jgi:hypothetical protein
VEATPSLVLSSTVLALTVPVRARAWLYTPYSPPPGSNIYSFAPCFSARPIFVRALLLRHFVIDPDYRAPLPLLSPARLLDCKLRPFRLDIASL